MRFLFFSVFLLVLFLCSCRSQRYRTTNYLQNIDTSTKTLLNLAEPRIHKNDLLSIKVYSQSADPRTDIPYNLPEQTPSGNANPLATAGFLVDDKGTIDFPRLGTLQVEGLTKSELAQQLKGRLEEVLKNPSVIVRFLNYRVTVLGEVRSPGTYPIPAERVTILEALGLAGDITDYGKKDTVKVVREINGRMEVGYLSLMSENLFNSPYFRLQQNDVVFVEQNRRKLQQQEQQTVAQQVGIATCIITAIALIVNIIRF